jgi:mono/diheme cytochrome c family protein
MRRQCVLLALVVILVSGRMPPAAAASPGAAGTWVVNPADPGPDIPPVGRSLFDFLVTDHSGNEPTYRIPFPFSALRDKLLDQLQTDPYGGSPLKQVLIPLGRSLQRTAAAPEFFHSPRVVLAVDGEPAPAVGFSGMFLKDRLYIGYQETAAVLEIISYNEAAGRFEFQVVNDYRASGSPEVSYANRAICTACHQNATPIFSRPLWGETNANQQIAALLQEQDRDFYGVPLKPGIDIPNAIDDATDRANLIPAVQFIWKHACAVDPDSLAASQCRGQALRFALQYRLSGSLQFTRDDNPDWQRFAALFMSRWQTRWPRGLLISSPDIPNRVPVTASTPGTVPGAGQTEQAPPAKQAHLLQQLHVPSRLDPLLPRPPLDTWTAAGAAERFITGLASFMAEVDIERLDRQLFEQHNHTTAAYSRYHADCTLTPRKHPDGVMRISLRCNDSDPASAADFSMSARVYLRGTDVLRGMIDRLAWGNAAVLGDLTVSSGELVRQSGTARLTLQLARGNLHARGPDGQAIEDIQISWSDADQSSGFEKVADSIRGQALLSLRDDYQAVKTSIRALSMADADTTGTLSSQPFRRVTFLAALHRQLGMPVMQACCVDASQLPAPQVHTHSDDARLKQLTVAVSGINEQAFYRHCATCHLSRERFPPNFLQGDPSQVRDNLAHCAERLYVRLHMWNLPISARSKTPMPPVQALQQLGVDTTAWPDSTALNSLQAYARELLQTETGTAPVLEELLARGYEKLRPCLAGRSESNNAAFSSPTSSVSSKDIDGATDQAHANARPTGSNAQVRTGTGVKSD